MGLDDLRDNHLECDEISRLIGVDVGGLRFESRGRDGGLCWSDFRIIGVGEAAKGYFRCAVGLGGGRGWASYLDLQEICGGDGVAVGDAGSFVA